MTDGQRVLVTGAAGFIGGHLARTLASSGQDVIALDVEPLAESTLALKRITPVQGDIRDRQLVATAMQGVSVVYHQAAVASVPESFTDPAHCMAVNSEGSAIIFEQARLAGVQRVVMASTSAVYGDDPTPIKHEQLTPKPMSPYAVSKLAMEMLADVYARQYGMEMIALRYFNVYGPGQPAEGGYAAVIPAIRKAILTGQPMPVYGDGEQTRSFIYVGDIVRANQLAASTVLSASEGVVIANLASDVATSLNMLLQSFEEVIGRPIPVEMRPEREGDIKHSAGDTSYARERFGFVADVTLIDGLGMLLESEY